MRPCLYSGLTYTHVWMLSNNCVVRFEAVKYRLSHTSYQQPHKLVRARLHGGGEPLVGEVTRKIKRVYMQSYNPGVLGWGFLRLLLRFQLRSLSRSVPSSHLEKDERLILGHMCIYSWKRHALCYAVFGFARNRWLNTLYGIVWETKYGRFTTLNILRCEHFTLLECPLRFLVIAAMRRLGNVQRFKTNMFRFWAFCHECDPG